jgi:hypothetical protein
MGQNQHRYFKTQVLTYDQSGLHETEKCIYYPGHDSTNGIGKFIDKSAYDYYIGNTYADQLKKLNANIDDPGVSDELVLFEIGKTAILMLLAQQDCEGIRLTQITRQNDHGQVIKSFIVQGIKNEHDPQAPQVAKAVKALEGVDDVMTEEIHGFNLREVYKIIQGNGVANKVITPGDITKLLW